MNNDIVWSADMGRNFHWGVAMAAQQNEGAYKTDGRGLSVWDVFANRKGKIKNDAKPSVSCDFYYRYKDDLLIAKALGFKVFRFSVSWSRIIPHGTGAVNKKGIEFYNRVIDECLRLDIIPYVTLYHWDLPYELEKEGGWTSYRILHWFQRFAAVCAEAFGDRVKHWIVLNEPAGFTTLGYMLGKHAPGKTGFENYLPAIHNAVLAQADGGRIVRSLVDKAYIGTSFSCSEILPYSNRSADIDAANRIDILLNRLFIEPALGMGYPRQDEFGFLQKLEIANKAWKYSKRMSFDFDFIGIQNYFPVVIRYNPVIPVVQASEVKPMARKVPHTDMGWEVNAESFYRLLKRFWQYDKVKQIIVSESGAFYKDELKHGIINDTKRIDYFQQYIAAMHRAKKEGVNIKGYFAWTLTDNFEWAEGFHARFGLVHVDFKTQLRTIKNSGYWFRDFLGQETGIIV